MIRLAVVVAAFAAALIGAWLAIITAGVTISEGVRGQRGVSPDSALAFWGGIVAAAAGVIVLWLVHRRESLR